MTVFVALILTIAAFAIIAYPFFRQRSRLVEADIDDQSQELLYKKDTALSMLKELEFDHQSGILTDEDFQELEDRYKKRAIAILKDIDSLGTAADMDAGIEDQITRLRQGRPTTAEEEIERRVGQLRKKKPASVAGEIEERVSNLRRPKGKFCPQCGAGHEPSDRFCSECGTKLNRGDK
ncbi:MAG: zinc-ribbon domain-containing protein [Chloroflexi bacterium]|nr:zinc-ribbon domain-containing protein [Chloroflexota bacterium]